MKLAIMQPYLFPYIGYFQLIQSVDKFVFYDDVAFIKQGWINRNNFLLNDKAFRFHVPVQHISSFETINKTEIHYKITWSDKLLKTIYLAYRKAPFFNDVYPVMENVLKTQLVYISEMARESVKSVCRYLELKTELVDSSIIYGNSELKSEDRIIDIVKLEKASAYINMVGGKELYSKEHFKTHGLDLFFLTPAPSPYKQFNNEFVPYLSIMDVLMFNSPEKVRSMLTEYSLS
jgi:hypothetical protein